MWYFNVILQQLTNVTPNAKVFSILTLHETFVVEELVKYILAQC